MKTLLAIAALLIVTSAHAGAARPRPINPVQRPPAPTRTHQSTTGNCVMLKAVGGGWWYPPCMR